MDRQSSSAVTLLEINCTDLFTVLGTWVGTLWNLVHATDGYHDRSRDGPTPLASLAVRGTDGSAARARQWTEVVQIASTSAWLARGERRRRGGGAAIGRGRADERDRSHTQTGVLTTSCGVRSPEWCLVRGTGGAAAGRSVHSRFDVSPFLSVSLLFDCLFRPECLSVTGLRFAVGTYSSTHDLCRFCTYVRVLTSY